VVKVAKSTRKITANRREWQIWQALKDTDKARYLAPCIAISSDNKILIQQRAYPSEISMPRAPGWLTDMKPANCGWIDDRLVSIDYDSITIVKRLGLKG